MDKKEAVMLLMEHSIIEAAKIAGVNWHTIKRWRAELQAQGLPVPKVRQRRVFSDAQKTEIVETSIRLGVKPASRQHKVNARTIVKWRQELYNYENAVTDWFAEIDRLRANGYHWGLLASVIGVSRQTLNRWYRKQCIPATKRHLLQNLRNL